MPLISPDLIVWIILHAGILCCICCILANETNHCAIKSKIPTSEKIAEDGCAEDHLNGFNFVF